MASLSKDGNGWRILFVCPTTKKRRTIRTGKCAKKNAETARNMIEKLIQAKRLGTALDGQTAEWLKSVDDTLRRRLAKAGLADSTPTMLLGDFLKDYIDQRRRRDDVAPGTLKVWGHTRDNLVAFFGEDRDMRTVTPAQVDEWAAWMREDQKLAENSVRKRSQFAKMFFKVAMRRRLIAENPFTGLVSTVVPVHERQYFVPRETVTPLLEQCRGIEYRLLLIFARYMGVRVPSEIVPLQWTDVNWENLTLVITSPKTKRHRGGESRVCPIFPEVLPYLQEAWDAAPDGAVFIFPSIRRSDKNLRTWLEKAIQRSGLTPWPRLWQNLRATRATELVDQFPSHVAAAWLGHTETVANTHYRQVTTEHVQRAATKATGPLPSSLELAQKPAHSSHASANHGLSQNKKRPGNVNTAKACTGVDTTQRKCMGIEPTSRVVPHGSTVLKTAAGTSRTRTSTLKNPAYCRLWETVVDSAQPHPTTVGWL